MSAVLQRKILWNFPISARGLYLSFGKYSIAPFSSSELNAITGDTSSKLNVANVTDKQEKKNKRARPRTATESSELKKYVAGLPFLLQSSSFNKLLRVQKNPPDSVYLVDSAVAHQISEKLAAENLDPNSTVVEINPGHGLLTAELTTKFRFKKINCFEEDEQLGEHLLSKFKNKINLIPLNFIGLPRTSHADQMDGGDRIESLLKNLNSSKSDTKNNKMYIFGASPSHSTVNYAQRSLLTQNFLFDQDWNWDVTYYLALGSKAFAVLTATPESGFTEYRQSSVSFQLFFKYESFGELPRKAFLPWQTLIAKEKKKDSRAQIRHDPNTMQFVKFTPNTDVISKVGVENLIPLWYFIRHHLFTRRGAVIPELEQWIPGCGPRLIRQGYTIYTQFGSLPPLKILELFLEFISWPEFESCSFDSAVEKFISKMDLTDEDV